MTETLSARDLFRAAYENRYTWDSSFPGYSTDITVKQGDRLYTGKARINHDLTYEISDVSDEKANELIKGQVWEIAVHRVRKPFEETHGKNVFELGETDETGAVAISVSGKAMGDGYKVRNNEVSLVHRHIHNVVVTINTFSTIDTGEGYLAERYDSVYHDATTNELKGSSQSEDTYEKIGNYYILTRRVITEDQKGEAVVTEYGFSHIKLLTPVAV
ncbi:MAG: DUF3386 domain-containing protein [Tildeniella nuda ZEHNDER 1965/U140]|jgi:hypothetical protein|nr:DUF3386 domain-containing protein [Tildeniella nuda ZEHNDER 1965/U140]